MKVSERIAFLRNTELLSEAPDELLARICEHIEDIDVATGAVLFREGDPGDAVYLVVEGALSIERDGIQLITLGAGGCIGEFALIDDGPRSASVVAQSDARLLKWGREAFQHALSRSPQVASGLLKTLIGKLRRDVAVQVEVGLEQERWRQDLKRATEIQMGMLPKGDLKSAHVEISGYCRPAEDVGGDYYDYLCVEEDKVGLILGDVMGHGFYSGLFVAMAKSCVHTQATIDYAPERMMEAMNHTVFLSIQSGMLMTCCYVLLDPRRHSLTYTNAGHNYPYHYSRRSGELEPLVSTDLLLGVPGFEAAQFSAVERTWETGDLLLLYSDGIPEAKDVDGEMFENERLEEAFMENRDLSPALIKEALLLAHACHCKGVEQSDDITLVIAKAL